MTKEIVVKENGVVFAEIAGYEEIDLDQYAVAENKYSDASPADFLDAAEASGYWRFGAMRSDFLALYDADELDEDQQELKTELEEDAFGYWCSTAEVELPDEYVAVVVEKLFVREILEELAAAGVDTEYYELLMLDDNEDLLEGAE